MTETQQISSEIKQFYSNKCIFLTGATGSIGKCLLEKLLRDCPEIDKIFFLIRHKKGKTPSQRIDELVQTKLFDKLKEKNPNFKSKLIPIEGDLVEPNLGISPENRAILIKYVNIVFHLAATIKFDEPLKVAVNMNVTGTKKVIDLCKELENLSVFVHVSTAYANCDHSNISEDIYPVTIQPDALMKVADSLDNDLLEQISPKLVKDKPNTYTFTKSVAEKLVVKECSNIPCTIVRPSIVTSTWKEPMPGWIDNYTGLTGLMIAGGHGLQKTMPGHPDSVGDLIPVDSVVNMIICAGWYRGVEKTKKLNIYNFTSGQLNEMKFGRGYVYVSELFLKYPMERVVFYPSFAFSSIRSIRYIREFFQQIIPSFLLDVFSAIFSKKKTNLMSLQKKISKNFQVIEYFALRSWKFKNNNVLTVLNDMNETDKQMFNIDIRSLDWKEYFENYYIGIKVYMLNEKMSNVEESRKKLKRMKRKINFAIFSTVGIAACIGAKFYISYKH